NPRVPSTRVMLSTAAYVPVVPDGDKPTDFSKRAPTETRPYRRRASPPRRSAPLGWSPVTGVTPPTTTPRSTPGCPRTGSSNAAACQEVVAAQTSTGTAERKCRGGHPQPGDAV